MRFGNRRRANLPALAVLLSTLVVVAAACGSSSTSSSSPSPSGSKGSSTSSAAIAAQVKASWQTFFDGTTPAARKIALLQNGQQFAQIINAQAGLPIAKSTKAVVSAVNVTSASTATVKYSITLGGNTALADRTGQAVLENGVWKVGDSSFAALLALEGVKVPMPTGSSSTGSTSVP